MTTSHPCFSYDVFLSFRGEDTRKNFTDHLYAALKQAGICTFRDDDAMDRGKRLDPELKKAIRESAISIIVFSKDYASSKWCLDEVLTIIEEQERLSSKNEVVPVFYNVEPSDVRNQTGSFKEAFDEYDNMIHAETDHEKKIQLLEKVKAWRVSLRKAGSLTGMVLDNGYEAKFISKIVDVIRKKLNYKILYVEEKLVGIENNIAEIESWLQDPSPNAVVLFIHGMGGTGKTTISKCIYNSNYHEFNGSCFLADIHETSNQNNGLIRLQSQLLSTITKSNKEEVIWNHYEGTVKVTNALCSKKVLLILDDVTTREQLRALLGSQKFYPGSKVIITTRDKGLLEAFEELPMVHKVKELDPSDSYKLFSLHAFHRDHPIEPPYTFQSELVVNCCGGHPLALKVLGSNLKGKTIDVWEDAMRKLEAVPNPGIQKVLQVSYDTLEDTTDKDLFLHIACFFVGEDKEFIVKLLAECELYPIVGIQNLMDRCLLYIEYGRVMMHQLIQKMGREVVRQESPKHPGKRSRLWYYQDSFNALKENEGTRKVEGLALDMGWIKGINSTSNKETLKFGAIEKMKNLMLLKLDYATFSGTCKNLPKKLRLLRWHGFPFKSIPCDIPLQKLVVLDLRYSKLKEVWMGFKEVGSLKILDLSYSVELIKTPDFRGLLNLESLLLEGCSSMTQVCESIGCLERLVFLNISGCRSLKKFPCLPRSLVSFNSEGCSNLGGLGLVQCLDSFSQFSLLVDINVSGCQLSNNSFLGDWSKLFSLKSLNISRNHITSLPGCVKDLPSLESLYATYCSHLQSLLDVPKSVTNLYADNNMSLEIVQPPPHPFAFHTTSCKKLCTMEGYFKFEPIKNVDRKVQRYIGLESISEKGVWSGCDKQNAYTKEDTIKVLYEFGIFSTIIPGKTLPCFSYKDIGSTISFRIPSHPNGSRITGLNVCFMATCYHYEGPSVLSVKVHNKTKVLVWSYTPTVYDRRYLMGKPNYVWLSLWRTGNLLDDGDEVVVSIVTYEAQSDIVEEWCVNFIYDDDDGEEILEGQKKGTHCISWTDKVQAEVSNYVHSGKRYLFMNRTFPLADGTYDFLVDWWGIKAQMLHRQVFVGVPAGIHIGIA